MTEPTAEQIEAERERARAALHEVRFSHHIIGDRVTGSVATALARVRKEAHAAGWDEAIEEAAKIAGDCGDDDCGCQLPIAHAIRALRGHT